jgi:YVTN family beta-propeller protein
MTTGKLLATAGILLALVSLSSAQKRVANIDIGGEAGLLAVNVETQMIYVPNLTLNAVTVVDAKSNTIVTNILVAGRPWAAAVNAITNLIYVSVQGTLPSIQVIDGSSNTVIAVVPATSPSAIAINPATNLIYFDDGAPATISVLDGNSNKIVATFSTSSDSIIQAIALNSTTNRIYVAENGTNGGNQLVVIDGRTNAFGTVSFDTFCVPRSVAVDSTLNRIYVGDDACNAHIVNGNNNQVVGRSLPGSTPVIVNSTKHIVGYFNFDVLSFANSQTLAAVGNPVNLPRNLTPHVIAAIGNTYYVGFRNSNGVAAISGP